MMVQEPPRNCCRVTARQPALLR